MEKVKIRHSLLPKLAACPKYRPADTPAGPAAERGTRIDAAIRAALAGDTTLLEALPPEDKAAAQWGAHKLAEYTLTGETETREEFLAMHTPGIGHVGTADAVNWRMGWVADIKSGQIRDYYHQLAAYALACMERTFAPAWAAHAIYVDQQKVISYRLDYGEAKRAVETVIARANDPTAEPRPCDYCDWCALKDTCPAVVKPVEEGLTIVHSTSLAEIKERLLADPEKLGAFVAQWKAVEKEVAKDAIDRARDLLEAGEEVPGWKLSKASPTEYYDADGIIHAASTKNAPLDTLVNAMGGKMSAKAYREWCAQIGHTPLESHLRQGKGITRLLQDRKKTKKLKA